MQRYFKFECSKNTNEVTFFLRERERELLIGENKITIFIYGSKRNEIFRGFADKEI